MPAHDQPRHRPVRGQLGDHAAGGRFIFVPAFLSAEEELALLQVIRESAFGRVRMRGVESKRRVAQFGWHYSFESFRLTEARAIPPEFLAVRERVAALADVAAEEFSEAPVTEYEPGAGIGWQRDAPPFGIVAGISLAGSCRMRFQRGEGKDRVTAAIDLPPHSMYWLTGSARTDWQHTIPPTKELRYSITFRTLKRRRD